MYNNSNTSPLGVSFSVGVRVLPPFVSASQLKRPQKRQLNCFLPKPLSCFHGPLSGIVRCLLHSYVSLIFLLTQWLLVIPYISRKPLVLWCDTKCYPKCKLITCRYLQPLSNIRSARRYWSCTSSWKEVVFLAKTPSCLVSH